jgi:hypothetical protein
MIFEDELGIKPAHWLRNPQLDNFLDDNCVAVLPWEELAVRQTGLHLSMIRLIVAAIATVPLGFLHRLVPTAYGASLSAAVLPHASCCLCGHAGTNMASKDISYDPCSTFGLLAAVRCLQLRASMPE